MRQNGLPEQFEEIGIKDLLDGEVGYTVPWAMYALADGRMYINGYYPFGAEPSGTSVMRIRRDGRVIVVDAETIGDYKFDATNTSIWTDADLPVELDVPAARRGAEEA